MRMSQVFIISASMSYCRIRHTHTHTATVTVVLFLFVGSAHCYFRFIYICTCVFIYNYIELVNKFPFVTHLGRIRTFCSWTNTNRAVVKNSKRYGTLRSVKTEYALGSNEYQSAYTSIFAHIISYSILSNIYVCIYIYLASTQGQHVYTR